MNEQQVVELMRSSNSQKEWDINGDKVKEACGGDFPDFWFSAILNSGVANETYAKWGGTPGLKIF